MLREYWKYINARHHYWRHNLSVLVNIVHVQVINVMLYNNIYTFYRQLTTELPEMYLPRGYCNGLNGARVGIKQWCEKTVHIMEV